MLSVEEERPAQEAIVGDLERNVVQVCGLLCFFIFYTHLILICIWLVYSVYFSMSWRGNIILL